jgi:predicted RNase H-like HicB family nuclease
MPYRIATRQSEEGFSVSVPGLPGCWSQGATEAEAIENIKNAIREYLSVVGELRGEEFRDLFWRDDRVGSDAHDCALPCVLARTRRARRPSWRTNSSATLS